jgi:signal transduction histidine kinase/ActR/RegA family two-component response regulator
MRTFRDLPIRRKLLLMTFATSATALSLAGAGFLAWDIARMRGEIRDDLEAQARIIADNSWAPLQFEHVPAALETLSGLRLRPRIVLACLHTSAGKLFADYYREQGETCPADAPDVALFGWDRVDVVVPVVTDEGREVGRLYVHRDLADVHDRLRMAGGIMVGILLLALATAFVIAARMQQSIVSPLLALAATAREVSIRPHQSIRAIPASNDEIGAVVRAFNEMLDRIADRTEKLSQANLVLEHEVDVRRRAEAERSAALERERDANRLKDEFLATLSHELRTPLNAVLGWARVLRSSPVRPATEARALESIERNARAQARLIEDLLEVSRIVTGKLRLSVRDTDLAAIVDAAIEVIRPAATAKRLHIAVEIRARPAMTSGDPDRLQQIVWNLLSNAVKFTPAEGHVSLRLETCPTGHRLTVADTGPGIDPQFLPFVFDPFRQADGTTSREHGGLGLGLAIARQLVELHGGTIHAYSSTPGEGATFEVRLPSALAASAVPDATSAPVPTLQALRVDESLLRSLHVLVVDDEEDARVLLKTALGQYGADVTTAASAHEALAAFDRRVPDVLVSDIGMPHVDGYELIERVRKRTEAAGGTVPAVAVTAYASARDEASARAAGYQAHVAKPLEPAQLAALVARLGRTATTRASR